MALRGVPPFGLGAFDRGSEGVPGAPYTWRAIYADASTTARDATQSKRLGSTWLFLMPDAWRDDTWRASLNRIITKCNALGCDGIIVNPEQYMTIESANAFGQALSDASEDVRIGLVTIPAFSRLSQLAAKAGGKIWATYEAYGRTARGAETFAAWHSRFEDLFGAGRVIPSIAGWVPETPLGRELASGEGYKKYLEEIPKACGAAAWTTSNTIPRHMRAPLSEYSPGGSEVGTLLYSLQALAVSPAGIGAGIASAAGIIALIAATSRK